MFSAIVLASIALASAQRAGQQVPELLPADVTHIADNTNPILGSNNQNGNRKQNARIALFVSDEVEEGFVGKAIHLQNAGIELQDEDGEFIAQNFLGTFVADESCTEIAARNNGRGRRFQFNGNDRGERVRNLNGQRLQLFNQQSVKHDDIDNNVLVGADFRFASIREVRDENIAKLVGAPRSAIIFQQNNINNQLFCLDFVAIDDVRNNDDLRDLEELVAFQPGSFNGFRVQDIVLTCDDRGKLEELERGWGGVAGFGVFERDVPNPNNPNDENDLLTGTTLLIDGFQLAQWDAPHYGTYEAVVSEQECKAANKGKQIDAIEIDNAELRIRNINLSEDNWHQGQALSNVAANHADNDEGEVQEDAVSEFRIEQGSLRNARLGSVRETAKGMFIIFNDGDDDDENDKAVACCDLVDVADVENIDKEINIDFLNDLIDNDADDVDHNCWPHCDNHHTPPHHDGGYDGNNNVDTDEDSDLEGGASSIIFSVGAAALALAAFF